MMSSRAEGVGREIERGRCIVTERSPMHNITGRIPRPANTGAREDARQRLGLSHSWMSRHGIPPLPMWLVCWFVIPLEAGRRRKRDSNRPQD